MGIPAGPVILRASMTFLRRLIAILTLAGGNFELGVA